MEGGGDWAGPSELARGVAGVEATGSEVVSSSVCSGSSTDGFRELSALGLLRDALGDVKVGGGGVSSSNLRFDT